MVVAKPCIECEESTKNASGVCDACMDRFYGKRTDELRGRPIREVSYDREEYGEDLRD